MKSLDWVWGQCIAYACSTRPPHPGIWAGGPYVDGQARVAAHDILRG